MCQKTIWSSRSDLFAIALRCFKSKFRSSTRVEKWSILKYGLGCTQDSRKRRATHCFSALIRESDRSPLLVTTWLSITHAATCWRNAAPRECSSSRTIIEVIQLHDHAKDPNLKHGLHPNEPEPHLVGTCSTHSGHPGHILTYTYVRECRSQPLRFLSCMPVTASVSCFHHIARASLLNWTNHENASSAAWVPGLLPTALPCLQDTIGAH